MRVSKSNKVCGYVKAVRYFQAKEARLNAKEQELLPLRREVTEAKAAMLERRKSMTGGQIGEAERILKNPPVLESEEVTTA